MLYKEEIRDLFSVGNEYILAHCISADFKMGAGIAVKFSEMGVRDELVRNCGKNLWRGHGFMIPTYGGREVCNLITKDKYYYKPTYETLTEALDDLKIYMDMSIKGKVAMPLIGCGLDRLEWVKVREIIQNVFADKEVINNDSW